MKAILKNKIKFIIMLLLIIIPFQLNYAQKTKYIAVSLANFDVLTKSNRALEARLEYRLIDKSKTINNLLGLMINTDGAKLIYAGFLLNIPIFNNISFTPSFSPGLYSKGNSKKLDFIIEFRSQIELSYWLSSASAFSISFSHISNASLGNSNPGVESLAFTYAFALND